MTFLNSIRANDPVEGFYLLDNASIKTSVRGDPFLAAEIKDKTKSLPIKVWDYRNPTVSSADNGTVVFVSGRAAEYNGSIQVTAQEIRKATNKDRFNRSDLVDAAPINIQKAYQVVISIVNSIHDGDYRELANRMLTKYQRALMTIPAAKSVHHAFVGGLLMHTFNMLRVADDIAETYQDSVNRDLLLTGVLIHDFAKCLEFTFSEMGLVVDYSIEGNLLGHLVMGAQEVAKIGEEIGMPKEKSILLQHLLLSHHGDPSYGAAVVPKVLEAELLHLIDMIDSRVEIYREQYSEMEPGTLSEKGIFALGNKRIYKQT